MRKPFLVCWKRHPPPWFTKFEFEKFFSLFYIISTQRYYIHQKLDTNGCFAKLRANSYLFSCFLYTLYILYLPCDIYHPLTYFTSTVNPRLCQVCYSPNTQSRHIIQCFIKNHNISQLHTIHLSP